MTGPNGTTGLTPKQEAFCRAYIETGNASEAYRRAYDAANMKPATVNRKAVELLENGKVTARLTEYRLAAQERHEVTLDSLVQELEQARVLAMAKEAPSAAIAASMGKAKLLGLILDRAEHSGKDGVPLVPDVPARDVARAIVDILRQARIEGSVDDFDQAEGQEEPDEDPRDLDEQPAQGLMLGRSGAWGSRAPASPRSSLQPDEHEILDNGASIFFDGQLGKHAIYNTDGQLCGFRRELQTAREFAGSLKTQARDQE